MRLTIHEVAIHTKGGKSWAQLPARPWVKDGSVVTADDGKTIYMPMLEFDSAAVRTAFSTAAIAALLRFRPDALRGE